LVRNQSCQVEMFSDLFCNKLECFFFLLPIPAELTICEEGSVPSSTFQKRFILGSESKN
jgi:hypothetical protein